MEGAKAEAPVARAMKAQEVFMIFVCVVVVLATLDEYYDTIHRLMKHAAELLCVSTIHV